MLRTRLPYRRAAETFDLEVAGLRYTATIGRFADGRVAEVFLNNHRINSAADVHARDAAIAVSFALQHGADFEDLRRALSRDANGRASGPLGAALDLRHGGLSRARSRHYRHVGAAPFTELRRGYYGAIVADACFHLAEDQAGMGRDLASHRVRFHIGLGLTVRHQTEFVLLARRGNCWRKAKDVRELIIAPRREHSRKPAEFFARVERYCAGPYVELFARERRTNWDCFGDEVGKFDQPLSATKNAESPAQMAAPAIRRKGSAIMTNNLIIGAPHPAYPGRGTFNGLVYVTLKLNGEAGEAAEKVGKVLRDSDGVIDEARRKGLASELGDVCWYVAAAATELGDKLSEITTLNLEKIARRRAHGTQRGEGDDR